MSLSQVVEGTGEEIAALLQSEAYARRKVRVSIEANEEDFSDNLPDPPTTIHDRAHLEQLLLTGLASPARELTDADWQELHRRAQDRLERKVS